ncbi:MAG: phosphatidylserine decarboxylase [Burkholderiales bacterium]
MSRYPHPIIAREGWPHLVLALAVAIAVTFFAGWFWALPFWIICVFILQFFRDPARPIPSAPNVVLSPADGRVVSVEKTTDPYLKRDALRISVFMNVFNAHSNRSPVEGTIKKRWEHRGRFFNASLAKASFENERTALWIKTPNGHDITCVQVAGLIARRILCYVKPGDQLMRGARYGFIRFGSRLDVYVRPDSRAKTSVGEKVYAAKTIIAELPAPH